MARSSTVMQVLALTFAVTATSAQLANTFRYVGLSGVSAQQMFLGTKDTVYIVDKTGQCCGLVPWTSAPDFFAENNNGTQINGHAPWATEFDLRTNTYRSMDIVSNSFCAGGTVLGNGTWLNVGGNNAVVWGGATDGAGQTVSAPYFDYDGGKALRLLNPCDDQSCEWQDDPAMYMTSRRWYPTLETLEDGSALIFGGCEWGGYVNFAASAQNNPTIEVSHIFAPSFWR